MDLVIMAAGMGSRFGGLKQVEPINEQGEFILDYSVYDAIKAGFDRIVFIIKEENLDLFRSTVGKRIESKIKVEYVFQDINNRPDVVDIPSSRVKPLGTAHAIYCLQGIVSDKFAVINADDFYGRDAFKVAHDFLAKQKDNKNFGTVNYNLADTLSEFGAAKRGVCDVDENGYIVNIIESEVERVGVNQISCKPLSGASSFVVDDNKPVSMNMLALNSVVLEYLNDNFADFLLANKDNLEKCEYLIPDVIAEMVDAELVNFCSIKTTAKWKGVTYKEDKADLVNYIKQETLNGVYPELLWGNENCK